MECGEIGSGRGSEKVDTICIEVFLVNRNLLRKLE